MARSTRAAMSRRMIFVMNISETTIMARAMSSASAAAGHPDRPRTSVMNEWMDFAMPPKNS